MKLSDILKCALPIICEHDNEQYPYGSPPGTCFAITFRQKYWIVTANHILKNHNINPDMLRVPYHQGASAFIPLNTIHRPPDDCTEDYNDIVFLAVDSILVNQQEMRCCNPIVIDEMIPNNTFDNSSLLVVRGYPECLGSIDYDTKKIVSKGFTVEAKYKGKSSLKCCSQLEFHSLDNVDSLNGLSGSPILHITRTLQNGFLYNFAGMMIRASREFKTGHFINSNVIHKALASF